MRQPLPAHTHAQHNQPIKRLLKTRDYKHAYAAGTSSLSPSLKMCVVANQLDYTRLGVVVGKRVSQKAVLRNRIKRVIKHLAQERLPAELRKSHDIVIIARSSFVCAQPSRHLRADLKTLFHKWPL